MQRLINTVENILIFLNQTQCWTCNQKKEKHSVQQLNYLQILAKNSTTKCICHDKGFDAKRAMQKIQVSGLTSQGHRIFGCTPVEFISWIGTIDHLDLSNIFHFCNREPLQSSVHFCLYLILNTKCSYFFSLNIWLNVKKHNIFA